MAVQVGSSWAATAGDTRDEEAELAGWMGSTRPPGLPDLRKDLGLWRCLENMIGFT